ncbi:MAG TPA: type II toxin-antitoxin system HicB family antitoxin [Pyrinomonadaceae bacterium]|nr:type II toxin-antitoxin system HicB family antitoxin [Pyrinomonadaceae bacterium]
MSKHQVAVYYSEEDEIFIAEATDLPGCMAHGKTRAEALENIDDAIELWLETAEEFGDEIPEPVRRPVAA